MSYRNTPSSKDAFPQLIASLDQRLRAIERGKNRGPGSSFGLPFVLVGASRWVLDEDEEGNLVVTGDDGAEAILLAVDTSGEEG